MSSLRKRNLFVALALLAALLLFGTPTAAKQKDRLRYNLTAQGKGHVGLAAGRATRLILTISSWSTEAEHRQPTLEQRDCTARAPALRNPNSEIGNRQSTQAGAAGQPQPSPPSTPAPS